MNVHQVEVLGTSLFILAISNIFLAKKIRQLGNRRPFQSLKKLFHVLGEVEFVFGIWSLIFISILLVQKEFDWLAVYCKNLNFSEPLFVFTMMLVAASKPVLDFIKLVIEQITEQITKK